MSLESRFWSKVRKLGPDDCWPWLAATNEHGYGVMRPEGRRIGPTVKAHRVSALLDGRDPAGRVLREFAHRYRDGQPQPKRLIARYAYVGDSVQPVLIVHPSVVRGQELQRRP